MMYPLVLDLAADAIPVAVTCRVLGFTTQAFYKWRKNPVTPRDFDDAHLINAAIDIHADDPTFGYRFIADELAVAGFAAGENRVARLCSQERIWSIHAKKRGLNRKADPPVHDDHVKRVFTAAGPNLVWLTDITEHATAEGKLYLCADLGRALQPDRRLLDRLADEGVPGGDGAAQRGRAAGTRRGSDRAFGPGSQFRSKRFVRVLKAHRLRGSMGRVGACGDNAAMESFFALLQKNVLDRQRWATRAELRLAIVSWIETTYHRRRRQRGLGKLTPIKFETLQPVVLAA
jgi:putative transposase